MRRIKVEAPSTTRALNTFAKWASHEDTIYCVEKIVLDYPGPFLSEYTVFYTLKEDKENEVQLRA